VGSVNKINDHDKHCGVRPVLTSGTPTWPYHRVTVSPHHRVLLDNDMRPREKRHT